MPSEMVLVGGSLWPIDSVIIPFDAEQSEGAAQFSSVLKYSKVPLQV